MIEVTKRHDDSYPVGLRFEMESGIIHGTHINVSLKEARKLRMALSEAIDWAVNMSELRKENENKKFILPDKINDDLVEFHNVMSKAAMDRIEKGDKDKYAKIKE
jgi:hypothetical protein